MKLAKRLTPLQVFTMATGCIIGWGAFMMPGFTFLPQAGVMGTAIAMLAAAVVLSLIAYNYHFMIVRYPIAGGEYAYVNAAFGNNHAFICAWFLSLAYLSIVPLNATALALISRNLLDGILSFGFSWNVAGYEVFLSEAVISCGTMIFFAYLSICGIQIAGRIQSALVLALLTIIVLLTATALYSHGGNLTSMPMFSANVAPVAGIAAVFAVAPWAFVGFDTIPQAAEEFNFSPKKSRRIMIFSIFFGAFVYIALNAITALAIPGRFSSWQEYIAEIEHISGLQALPTFSAANELLGATGLIFLGVAVLAAVLSGILGFMMATSRLLFSLARDGILPEYFSFIHEKYQTPVNSILFVLVISCIFSLGGRTALSWLVNMSSIGAVFGFGYTSAAALAFAKKEGIKEKTIYVTSTLGIVFSALFAVILLVPLPGIDASLSIESWICLVIWVVAGLAFYKLRSYNFVKE